MLKMKYQWPACALTWGGLTAYADHDQDKKGRKDHDRERTVFVVAMENHNWTQPASTTTCTAA